MIYIDNSNLHVLQKLISHAPPKNASTNNNRVRELPFISYNHIFGHLPFRAREFLELYSSSSSTSAVCQIKSQ